MGARAGRALDSHRKIRATPAGRVRNANHLQGSGQGKHCLSAKMVKYASGTERIGTDRL
jgi:hypothetical protein